MECLAPLKVRPSISGVARKGKSELVQGKIIRGGRERIGGQEDRFVAPIIEVSGKRQFELPGTPLIPTAVKGIDLEPEFTWKISATKTGEVPAEMAYATYAINWFVEPRDDFFHQKSGDSVTPPIWLGEDVEDDGVATIGDCDRAVGFTDWMWQDASELNAGTGDDFVRQIGRTAEPADVFARSEVLAASHLAR
jgi:hypothetical protein